MRFTKVHGLGNDFILIDGRKLGALDYNALAVPLCDRKTGIGADGLLIVLDSETADIRMRIINSDGSEAEMCGNGIRCFAKYVYERGVIAREAFAVETLAGVMKPRLRISGGHVESITVDMGEPFLLCEQIPVLGEGLCVDRPLAIDGETLRITSVLVGVPHTVIYVDDPTDARWMALGGLVERAPIFPKRTNVNFARVIDRHTIEMRTFERGCGPTLACGTGACSTLVASALNDKTERAADIHIALGTLHIEWAADNHVYMTGPATLVFDGEIEA